MAGAATLADESTVASVARLSPYTVALDTRHPFGSTGTYGAKENPSMTTAKKAAPKAVTKPKAAAKPATTKATATPVDNRERICSAPKCEEKRSTKNGLLCATHEHAWRYEGFRPTAAGSARALVALEARKAVKAAEERIQAATPENWSVSVPQAAVVEDSAGDHMAWLVVFECALEVDGPATYGMSLRTLEVSAMGRTVEDILRVAESLPTIEAALCHPWPIDLEIKSEVS